MNKRIFLDSFSPALRQQITSMSDADYLEWEKALGIEDAKAKEENLDADIKKWAADQKKIDEILDNISGFPKSK